MKILTLVVDEKDGKATSIDVSGNIPIMNAIQYLILYDKEMFGRSIRKSIEEGKKDDS